MAAYGVPNARFMTGGAISESTLEKQRAEALKRQAQMVASQMSPATAPAYGPSPQDIAKQQAAQNQLQQQLAAQQRQAELLRQQQADLMRQRAEEQARQARFAEGKQARLAQLQERYKSGDYGPLPQQTVENPFQEWTVGPGYGIPQPPGYGIPQPPGIQPQSGIQPWSILNPVSQPSLAADMRKLGIAAYGNAPQGSPFWDIYSPLSYDPFWLQYGQNHPTFGTGLSLTAGLGAEESAVDKGFGWDMWDLWAEDPSYTWRREQYVDQPMIEFYKRPSGSGSGAGGGVRSGGGGGGGGYGGGYEAKAPYSHPALGGVKQNADKWYEKMIQWTVQ